MHRLFPTKKALSGYYYNEPIASEYAIMLFNYWIDRMVVVLIGV